MTAVQIQDFDELSELVSQEDIVVVQMQTLRSAANWDRLTQGAIDAIGDQLRGRALGVYPELSQDRWREVRVYKIGTPIGNLVESVTTPSDAGDRRLREAATKAGQEILQKIRGLVCEI